MAETIAAASGVSMTGFIKTRSTNAGQNANAAYGYQQYIALCDMNAGLEVHLIFGVGAPEAVTTYDAAPLSSLYFNVSGGNDTSLYVKEATGGSGWAPVTTGGAA